MVSAGRLIEVALATSGTNSLNKFLSAEVLFRTDAQKHIMNLVVELFAASKHAIVASLNVKSEDCTTETTNVRELIKVGKCNVERFVTAPRKACDQIRLFPAADVLQPGQGLEIFEGTWEILPVFRMLEKWGGVPHREMFNIFNMGVGMIAVMDASEAPKAISILEAHGEKASVIGEVTDQEGVNIILK